MNGNLYDNLITDIPNSESEIAIGYFFIKLKLLINYLKSKWLLICLISGLGAILGVSYSFFKKTTYTAICAFVLEDPGHGGAGQYGGLASLVGISVPNGTSGIFEGDNIIELYKSRDMIEKTLLTRCNFDGKSQLLIDRFLEKNKLKVNNQDYKISFSGDPTTFSRKQDSVITDVVELINKKVLTVFKPDKKLSIINVEIVSTDELFAKYFTDNIVKTVNDFYIETKTKKAAMNVKTLQNQADSVRKILNSSLYGAASAMDAAPNANPQLAILRVGSQKKQVDVQSNSAIYVEMSKNLELAKITLMQESPLIQIIDKPVFPLKKNKLGLIKGMVIGGLLFGLIIVIYLTMKKTLYKILNNYSI